MSDLSELIARIEAASGAQYVLDCAIWDAIYPGERAERFAKLTAPGKPYHGRLGPADVDGYVQPLRAFTASIDAALTLVPDGYAVDMTIGRYWPNRARVLHVYQDGDRWFHRGSDPAICANAATPALALCAAALKARNP